MQDVAVQLAELQIFNQFWLSLFLLVPLVLISRTAVAGTRYSPILIVVVFGLAMGYFLVVGGVSAPGLPEFHLVDLISRTTIIPLVAAFFVGGQELRKVFGKVSVEPDNSVIPCQDEAAVGTTRTQLIFIVRTFFLLIGIEAVYRLIVGIDHPVLTKYYSLLAYVGVVCAVVLIDTKATILNKRLYVKKGVFEMMVLVFILVFSFYIAAFIRNSGIIALPQIFYAMLMTCALGAVLYKWNSGPTLKALLFAGLPVVLGGNFMIGGSRIAEAFSISGMNSVLAFGFFGQIVWMFGGIALMMLFAKTANVRNLAPGLAGGLSHAGLTGACNAGDLGKTAQSRAPIMINMPFLAHVFVFSVLALSVESGELLYVPSALVFLAGLVLTALSLKTIRTADGNDSKEITGLMQFSLGWQLVAIFGSFILLCGFGMSLSYAGASATSSLSHFGLFAATQAGKFGPEVAELLPLIFAMPFLVHPFVFFLFGKAMENNGEMPKKPVYILTAIGLIGVGYSLMAI